MGAQTTWSALSDPVSPWIFFLTYFCQRYKYLLAALLLLQVPLDIWYKGPDSYIKNIILFALIDTK